MLMWSQHIREFTVYGVTGSIGANQAVDTEPPDFTLFAFHDAFYVVMVFQGMAADRADGIFTAFN